MSPGKERHTLVNARSVREDYWSIDPVFPAVPFLTRYRWYDLARLRIQSLNVVEIEVLHLIVVILFLSVSEEGQ